MKRGLRYLVLFLCFLAVGSVSAQNTIDALREQIRKAEEEKKITTELLNKTLKDQNVSQSQLKLIQSRIRSSKNIVNTLDKQINLIGNDINNKSKTISQLNSELEQLRKDYADMIKAAYKNYKLNNFLLFLFAADDFNDVSRRIEFMRRYNRMRETKALQIKELSDSISNQISELDRQKAELDKSKESRSSELASLGKDENQYKSSVNKLKAEENKLKKEIKAKQDIINKAQKQIEQIMAEEAKKSQKQPRTAAEDRYVTDLSGRFDDNKGKLPYPVRRGVIIDRFGTHPHATQKGLVVTNNGVNISGDKGADVHSVFEGTVTRVFSLPGYNTCLIVSHGKYLTLYANMASVSVKTGDKVSLNQKLGKLTSSSNTDDNFLHFEVWKEFTKMNPEEWLMR